MQRFFLLAACAALFLVGCGDDTTKKDGAKDGKADVKKDADSDNKGDEKK